MKQLLSTSETTVSIIGWLVTYRTMPMVSTAAAATTITTTTCTTANSTPNGHIHPPDTTNATASDVKGTVPTLVEQQVPVATTTTTTTTTLLLPAVVSSGGAPPESSQHPSQQPPLPIMILPEQLYPIKSCLSHKNLFLEEEEEGDDSNYNLHWITNIPPSPKMKKSVSFHHIEIREHERTISDNPSVSSGIGLGIGWESIDSLQCSVDEWEIYRPPRRSKSNLLIPSQLREQILRNECDITQGQINDSIKQITRIKQSRNQASKDPVPVVPSSSNNDDDNSSSNTLRRNGITDTVSSSSNSNTTLIPRRRSFMGLSRLLRPSKHHNHHQQQHQSMLVDMEVEQLMERSIRAEQIRQQQRLAYITALQKKQQEEEEDEQVKHGTKEHEPMDATLPEQKNNDTTTMTEPPPMLLPTSPSHLNAPPRLSSPSPFATTQTTTMVPPEHCHDRKSPEETEEEAWEF